MINRAISTILCICLMFNSANYKNKTNSVFNWGRDAFDTLIGDTTFDVDDYAGFQDNSVDYINYWINASNAVGLLCNSYYDNDDNALDNAKVIVDNLMSTYYRYGYFPRPQYDKYSYGWVSSMDSPVILLATQMLYEITGDKKYESYRDDLKELIMKTTKENGFIYNEGDDFWMFEYADKNTDPITGYYVLNGSLVGYQALYMVANSIEDEDYIKLCEKQLKSYKKMCNQYWYVNEEWSYYMLNPKKVNPPHYLLFEKKLFETLYSIQGDEFFHEESTKRERALKGVLKLYSVKENGNRKFYLLRACAPHPYQLDIYQTELEILDEDKNVIQTFYESSTGTVGALEFENGMFMTGNLKEEAVYYRIYSINGKYSDKYLIFESEIKNIDKTNNEKLNVAFNFSGDLKVSEGSLRLDKNITDDTKGNVIIDFYKSVPKDVESYIGIEVEVKEGDKIPVSIVLYDVKGSGVVRYYTPLVNGKNLILLSFLGFVDSHEIDDISRVMIRLHSANISEKENYFININDVYNFNNSTEVHDYISHSEYKINPQ